MFLNQRFDIVQSACYTADMKSFALLLTLFLAAALPVAAEDQDLESMLNPQPGTPQARMLERLKKLVDKDGDGVLSEEEKIELKQQVKKRQEQVRKEQDLNRDGQVDAEERDAFVARMQNFRKMLSDMFDEDKDGRMNEQEQLKAQEWLSTQKRLPLP